MSKTIDEKVVEMRFDNKHFETNVKTTLSTLDKLKAKLNLTGASKGLEEVNKASKKVDFSHMESSLASLEKRFSTMGIVGMTVIQNLTNAGLKFAKTLSDFSIGGIVQGGKARATKIENAQFQIKGLLRDFEDADKRLKDIMSDVNYGVESTAYGLDAAASVAAQLVASGMQAGDGMKAALRGISGVAAMTNSTYEDIGRIYTTVAGNGRLMGDQLLQLSSRGMNAAAVLAKSLNKTEAEIRDMVSKGKIDFATFSKAMDDAFGEHAKDANKTLNGVLSNIRAALAKIGADFYQPIIAENSPLIKFLNSVRERINDIRKTLSPITKEITTKINNMFTKIDEWFRGTKNILGFDPFEKFRDTLKTIQGPIEKVDGAIQTVTKTMKDYEKVVDEIIRGNFKNAPERYQLLAEAGYDWAHAQNLVNERLGCSVRHTTDFTPAVDNVTTATDELTDKTKNLIVELTKLSDEELRSKGYTEDQISALRTLGDIADKTGISIERLLELIDNGSFNTRFLIFDSIKNIGLTLVSILKSIVKAFAEVFSINPEGLFDVIAAFHKLTEIIKNRVEKNANKLVSTLKGLFSIIHLIASIAGGAFKFALNIINGILGAFNLTILDVTAVIGEAIFNFDRWVTSNNTFIQIGKAVIEIIIALVKWIGQAVEKVKEWAMQNEAIITFINSIRSGFDKLGTFIESWVQGLKETDNIPEYLFGGLINGIKQNAPKVFETIKMVAKNLIDVFKAMLGIHSPSTVFFEIGTNIWQGLVNGIKNGISFILGTLQSLGSTISNVLSSIDWGKVVAVGIGAGLIYTVKEITGLMNNLTKPLEGLSDLFSGLGSALSSLGAAAKNYTDSMKKKSIAKIILNVAIGLGILAAAVYFLSKIDTVKLWSSIGAIAVLAVILGALVIAITKFASSLDSITASLKDIGKVSLIIVGIGIGILLISKALKTIAGIDEEKMTSAFWTLIKIITALGLFIIAINRFGGTFSESSGKAFTGIGKMIKKIALALLIMVAVIKLAGLIKPHDVEMATQVVLLFGGIVTALLIVSRLAKYADKAGKMIKKVSISLLILVAAVKLAGLLKRSEIDRAIGMMSGFAIFMGILIAVSHFAGKEAAKAGLMMIEISIALMLLVGVMKFIGLLKPEDIYKGISVLGAFTIFMSILIGISHFAGKEAIKAGTMLLSVSAAMVVLAGVIFVLSKIDPEGLFRATAAVTVLGLMLATIVGLSRFAENAKGTIISITVCLVLLSIAIGILSLIDPQRLSASATALAEVMLGLASIIAATKFIKIEKGMFKNMLMLVAITALLAVVVAALSHFTNPQGAIASATALSVLMVALSGSLFILSKVKGNWKDIGKNILLLTAMIIPLLAFTAALAALSLINPQNLLPNILAVSSLMLAMIGLLAILNIITKSFDEKEIVTGILALTAMALPLLAFTGILYLMSYVDKAIESVNALVKLATACTLLMIPLSVIGAIVASGVGAGFLVAGILALTAMAIPMVAFVGILALMSGIENASSNAELLTTLMDKMVECLTKISLVAPLALVADAAMAGLLIVITAFGALVVAVGALMEAFPQLQLFIDKGLPVLEQLALGIGKVLGNIVSGFMSSVADELPNLGKKLSSFMINAMPFITIAQIIPNDIGNKMGQLIGAIAALAGSNLLEKVTSFLSGGESFSRLGTELSKFMINAMPFIAILNTVDPKVMEGAKNLADAVLSFTKGNLWESITSWLSGDNDIGEFGKKLAPLGTGLSEFVSNLGTFKPDQVDTVKSACEALKTISEVAGELPKHGGIAQAFTGDNDLGTFSGKLKNTGIAIRDFVSELTKDDVFNASKIDVVKSGCEVIKMIAEVAGELPKHGGMKQAFTGDNDISSFADKLGNVAAGIRGFVWELQKDGVITDKSIDKIHAVSSILYAISSLGQINLGDTSGEHEELGARLGSFGNKITEYVKGINTVSLDDLQSGKEKIDKIIEIANTLATVSSDPIEQLGEKLKNFATDALKKFVDGLNETQPRDDATNAIKALIDAIIKGMEEKKQDVENGSKAVVETAMTTLKSYDMSGAEQVGKNFVQGFANGINNNLYLARDAGSAVGKKALDAAKKSIDSHSPSKETYKLGTFFDQGFINGIKSLEDKIYSETYGVGDKARLGLGRAINGVSNLIAEGIDDEFTIRPVLDLSNVRSGAAAINSMFGVPSLGVSANLNAISSGMRTYRQNGGEDVISAIDRLGKNLGNTSGDTYNINGITYDNGTEIQEAVSTLVRAARIERRT